MEFVQILDILISIETYIFLNFILKYETGPFFKHIIKFEPSDVSFPIYRVSLSVTI